MVLCRKSSIVSRGTDNMDTAWRFLNNRTGLWLRDWVCVTMIKYAEDQQVHITQSCFPFTGEASYNLLLVVTFFCNKQFQRLIESYTTSSSSSKRWKVLNNRLSTGNSDTYSQISVCAVSASPLMKPWYSVEDAQILNQTNSIVVGAFGATPSSSVFK